MAFTMKIINDLKGILFLMLLAVTSQATNLNCKGKAFHCVNSTHFMICVDLGTGISTTIDDVVIPCPSPTVCRSSNHYECEFPLPPKPSSTTASTTVSEVTTFTPLLTTAIPFVEYFDTVRTTTLSENVSEVTDPFLAVETITPGPDIGKLSTTEIVLTDTSILVTKNSTMDLVGLGSGDPNKINTSLIDNNFIFNLTVSLSNDTLANDTDKIATNVINNNEININTSSIIDGLNLKKKSLIEISNNVENKNITVTQINRGKIGMTGNSSLLDLNSVIDMTIKSEQNFTQRIPEVNVHATTFEYVTLPSNTVITKKSTGEMEYKNAPKPVIGAINSEADYFAAADITKDETNNISAVINQLNTYGQDIVNVSTTSSVTDEIFITTDANLKIEPLVLNSLNLTLRENNATYADKSLTLTSYTDINNIEFLPSIENTTNIELKSENTTKAISYNFTTDFPENGLLIDVMSSVTEKPLTPEQNLTQSITDAYVETSIFEHLTTQIDTDVTKNSTVKVISTNLSNSTKHVIKNGADKYTIVEEILEVTTDTKQAEYEHLENQKHMIAEFSTTEKIITETSTLADSFLIDSLVFNNETEKKNETSAIYTHINKIVSLPVTSDNNNVDNNTLNTSENITTPEKDVTVSSIPDIYDFKFLSSTEGRPGNTTNALIRNITTVLPGNETVFDVMSSVTKQPITLATNLTQSTKEVNIDASNFDNTTTLPDNFVSKNDAGNIMSTNSSSSVIYVATNGTDYFENGEVILEATTGSIITRFDQLENQEQRIANFSTSEKMNTATSELSNLTVKLNETSDYKDNITFPGINVTVSSIPTNKDLKVLSVPEVTPENTTNVLIRNFTILPKTSELNFKQSSRDVSEVTTKEASKETELTFIARTSIDANYKNSTEKHHNSNIITSTGKVFTEIPPLTVANSSTEAVIQGSLSVNLTEASYKKSNVTVGSKITPINYTLANDAQQIINNNLTAKITILTTSDNNSNLESVPSFDIPIGNLVTDILRNVPSINIVNNASELPKIIKQNFTKNKPDANIDAINFEYVKILPDEPMTTKTFTETVGNTRAVYTDHNNNQFFMTNNLATTQDTISATEQLKHNNIDDEQQVTYNETVTTINTTLSEIDTHDNNHLNTDNVKKIISAKTNNISVAIKSNYSENNVKKAQFQNILDSTEAPGDKNNVNSQNIEPGVTLAITSTIDAVTTPAENMKIKVIPDKTTKDNKIKYTINTLSELATESPLLSTNFDNVLFGSTDAILKPGTNSTFIPEFMAKPIISTTVANIIKGTVTETPLNDLEILMNSNDVTHILEFTYNPQGDAKIQTEKVSTNYEDIPTTQFNRSDLNTTIEFNRVSGLKTTEIGAAVDINIPLSYDQTQLTVKKSTGLMRNFSIQIDNSYPKTGNSIDKVSDITEANITTSSSLTAIVDHNKTSLENLQIHNETDTKLTDLPATVKETAKPNLVSTYYTGEGRSGNFTNKPTKYNLSEKTIAQNEDNVAIYIEVSTMQSDEVKPKLGLTLPAHDSYNNTNTKHTTNFTRLSTDAGVKPTTTSTTNLPESTPSIYYPIVFNLGADLELTTAAPAMAYYNPTSEITNSFISKKAIPVAVTSDSPATENRSNVILKEKDLNDTAIIKTNNQNIVLPRNVILSNTQPSTTANTKSITGADINMHVVTDLPVTVTDSFVMQGTSGERITTTEIKPSKSLPVFPFTNVQSNVNMLSSLNSQAKVPASTDNMIRMPDIIAVTASINNNNNNTIINVINIKEYQQQETNLLDDTKLNSSRSSANNTNTYFNGTHTQTNTHEQQFRTGNAVLKNIFFKNSTMTTDRTINVSTVMTNNSNMYQNINERSLSSGVANIEKSATKPTRILSVENTTTSAQLKPSTFLSPLPMEIKSNNMTAQLSPGQMELVHSRSINIFQNSYSVQTSTSETSVTNPFYNSASGAILDKNIYVETSTDETFNLGKNFVEKKSYTTTAPTLESITDTIQLSNYISGIQNKQSIETNTESILPVSSIIYDVSTKATSDILVDTAIEKGKTHSGINALLQDNVNKETHKAIGTAKNKENVNYFIKTPTTEELAPPQNKIVLAQTTNIPGTLSNDKNNNNVQMDVRTREELLINLENNPLKSADNKDREPLSLNNITTVQNNVYTVDNGYTKETPTHTLIENSSPSTNGSHTSNDKSQHQNKSIIQANNKTVISNDQSNTFRNMSLSIPTATVDKQTSGLPTFESTTPNIKSKFRCKNKMRGKYADENDCRKFYICIGNSHIIEGTCPVNTVFSKINKQCTKNLSHCIRNNQFRCVTEGRFSDFLNDNVYYICVKNNVSHFIRFKLLCQKGYRLNKTSVRCVLNTKSTSTSDISRSVSEQSMSSVKQVTDDEPLKKFKCEEEGRFPHPSNCRKYFVCTKSDKSEYRQKRKKCDSDEIFHKDKKKCVDADSYEC